MKKLMLLVLVMMLAAMTGCSGPKMAPSIAAPPDPVEKLIWSSSAERPGWTMEEPDTVDGVMTFVGLSNRFASEQGAREDARRSATNAVVKYMGTLVKDKFEKAKVSYGLESAVVDPTASAREFEKQLAVNMATKVKVKQWYMEKWQTPTGIGYQAFALANVPQEAIDDSYKSTARDMARKAEQQAKEAGDQIAKAQAEKAADFWKQMQEQGVVE